MGTVEFWDMLSEEFRIKRNKDFDFYAPKEYDLSLSLEDRRKYCDEWTFIGLTDLSNEKLHEKDFDLLIKDVIDNKKLILRDHVKEIFKFADDNNIPLYILSAGLGNVIEHVMKYAIPEYQSLIDKKLLVLVSNFLTFDEKTGLVNGFKKPVLNTFSKVDVRLISYIKI